MKNAHSILPVVALLVLVGCGTRAQPVQTPTTTPVRVEPVTTAKTALPVRAAGTLAPDQTLTLAFKVGGPIAQVLVEEGDQIREGQLLAILALDEIDAAVAQARAARDKAFRDSERMSRLYADSVVTLEQLQNAETGLAVAEAALTSATFNRSYAEIRSPAAGRVQRRFAEVHEQIAPGSAVFQIGVEGTWVLRAGLPDVDVVRMRIGDAAAITFDARPGRDFRAVVAEVGEVSDARSGTFEVELAVSDPDRLLKAGFVGTAAITPSESPTFEVVPVEALVRASGREGTVFVVDRGEGTVSSRQISIAHILGTQLVVSSGVSVGDEVVTSGAAYLADGDAVTVLH